MTTDNQAAVEALEAAKWRGELCPNPAKGWILDSRGNRLTKLGNRNAYGKLITAHNNEIEVLQGKIKSALTTNSAKDAAIWQPIETAPRDGTCFLGYDPFLGCVFVGYMLKFYEGFKFVSNAIVRDAEHWMPLPSPPQAKGKT